MLRPSAHAARIAALVLVVAACGDSNNPAGPAGIAGPAVSSIELTPQRDTIFVRDSLLPTDVLQLQARAYGFGGGQMSGTRMYWRVLDSAIVSVDDKGLVRPRSLGETQVEVWAGNKSKRATVVVAHATQRIVVTSAASASATIDSLHTGVAITPTDVRQLRAVALDAAGDTVRGVRFTWISSDPAIATVDSTGRVRPVQAGRYGLVTITATGADASSTRQVRVLSTVREVRVSPPPARVVVDDTVRLAATAIGWNGSAIAGAPVTWASSNPAVATIDANGLATFLAPGTATFTATSIFVSGTASPNVDALVRRYLSVDAGFDQTCSTITLDRMYCWGVPIGNMVEDPTCAESTGGAISCALVPKRVEVSLVFDSWRLGTGTACGLLADGRAYCWGSGPIGNGSGGGSPTPRLVTSGLRFSQIDPGGGHSCAVTTSQLVYCWGSDVMGQLGTQVVQVSSTTPIPAEVPGGPAMRSVSAGYRHTCALDTGGQAFCWGSNISNEVNATPEDTIFVPVQVAAGFQFSAISASGIAAERTPGTTDPDDFTAHTCGLTTDNRAVCWGSNTSGQIGNGATGGTVTTPTVVTAPVSFTQVSTGGAFTCALGTDRRIYCWGRNDLGQLGRGNPSLGGSGTPAPLAGAVAVGDNGVIAAVPDPTYVSVSAGRRHACGLATDGWVYCWGSDVLGALGDQLQARVQPRPMRVFKPL